MLFLINKVFRLNKCKAKTCGFCTKFICHKSNQGDIKYNMRQCYQHVAQKYLARYFSMSSKILFLPIYCFKVSLFFIKDVIALSQIFYHLQETEHPDMKVSLILKLIIKIKLTLICARFVNSAVSTHLISQPTPVANK